MLAYIGTFVLGLVAGALVMAFMAATHRGDDD